ncbi:TRAP transporter substrate-binding protein DctP [Nocardioides insulae]|uniref:TRAP transporter substrate-binding protein DctP n=1 Tax=Nocardioides insulae TaxID=394734 RepID=UPI000400A3F9|nr:TRAP transporter substrate-binding protein DctP [Nocardioides insulae]
MALATATALSACAGSAGGSDSSSSGGGEGVEYGATPEEYQEALADMEPVTLKYQPGAQSAAGHTGEAESEFIKQVSELSGGKITLEPVWAQAIAPFDTVTEAVADGRLDLGIEIPIYTPSKYAAINDLINLTPSKPASPYVTEIAHTAAMLETAWDTPEVMDNYEAMGVTALRPAWFEFSNALMCTEPVTSPADLKGKQIRVGSAADLTIAEALGATGVSMQFVEAYEALQRNTIDCTFGGLRIGAEYGFLEVAPYVTFPTEAAWVRNPTALVAGPGYTNLPLAAQQVIYDAFSTANANSLEAAVSWTADALTKVEENGGDVVRLDEDAMELLNGAIDKLRQQTIDSENLDGQAAVDAFDENYDKWIAIAEEEGYENTDDYFAFADAQHADPVDLQPFSERMFEEIYLEHRPE